MFGNAESALHKRDSAAFKPLLLRLLAVLVHNHAWLLDCVQRYNDQNNMIQDQAAEPETETDSIIKNHVATLLIRFQGLRSTYNNDLQLQIQHKAKDIFLERCPSIEESCHPSLNAKLDTLLTTLFTSLSVRKYKVC